MSNQTIDPYQQLKIILNPDATLTRLFDDPHALPSSNTTLPTTSVLTKDVAINQSNNKWLRLFIPTKAISNHGTNSNLKNHKLPLIVFFHGSGFIIQSAASTMFHDFCFEMADIIEAVVASVEYRLAPEHRLPAAYDDAMDALHWIRNSQDEWLTQNVDYPNCYLMGGSAGATIAYHAGLQMVDEVDLLEPLKIQGLILHQPFFGGTQRSESELRLVNDPFLPLCVNDLMWKLALTIGVDRDHEYSNLTALDGLDEKFDKIRELGWRVLVSGSCEDPLVNREKELAKLMEEKGVKVVKNFQVEGYHGTDYFVPSKGKQLTGLVKGFISSFDV